MEYVIASKNCPENSNVFGQKVKRAGLHSQQISKQIPERIAKLERKKNNHLTRRDKSFRRKMISSRSEERVRGVLIADCFLTRQDRRVPIGNRQIRRRSSRVDDADGTEFKDAARLRHFQGSVIRILKQREAPVARGRLVTRKRATIAFVSGRKEDEGRRTLPKIAAAGQPVCEK
ncbi:hypothetical protein K0M31_001340 [Melipona bicolor]|uniref:Uncharacterized protein n=1 Tax=Melipona bicolor TaxID=60889 RepID=A0AA40KXJ7_9HYME|nr:hypothetical protein K0M31_001340 [Melipona bicolor]